MCLKLSDVKTRSHCGTKVQCRTRDPEVPRPNTSVRKEENISHRSNQNSNATYPSAAELNTWYYQRWQNRRYNEKCGRVQIEIHSSRVQIEVQVKKIPKHPVRTISPPNALHHSYIHENIRLKIGSHCSLVLELATRDPEIPTINHDLDKNKKPHWWDQNKNTTKPSAPELNTWNFQRWIT